MLRRRDREVDLRSQSGPAGRVAMPKTSSTESKFEGFRTYRVEGSEYLVTFFEARFKGSGTGFGVADQFTAFVQHYANQGYEFFRCDQVPYRITPGCLAGLFGAKETFGFSTIVSFRKKAA
jgi:hypothetical protein